MFSLIIVALVMVSLHNNRSVTKTHGSWECCFKNNAECLEGAKGRYEHLVLTVSSFGLGATKKTWAFELKWNEGYLDRSALHNKRPTESGPICLHTLRSLLAVWHGRPVTRVALSKGQCSNPLLALVSKVGQSQGPKQGQMTA